MRLSCFTILLIFFVSCSNEKIEYITDPQDYNNFLYTLNRDTYKNANNEIAFWSKRLRTDSSGIGDLGPLANAYTTLFEATANIEHLKDAERLYKKASKLPSLKKDAHIRSLAHNFMTQHRFKDAVDILERSYEDVSNKRATELMLFDVYFEIGDYDKAYQLLSEFENNNDFSYLIRQAKWNDHKGNMGTVLRSMEKAKKIIDARGSKQLKTWINSNLAIYYGHSGNIKESYNYFLKTLEIQPDHTLAKKGIAWIVYSFEKKTEEANRILDSITIVHKDPAHFLFKAELADFNDDESKSDHYKQKFIDMVENNDYGSMYNTDLIKIYTETYPKKSLDLAQLELKNRSTPLVYSLLAYAQLKNGALDTALKTIEEQVKGRTHEPIALFYSAIIYQSSGRKELLKEVKEQLNEASFELGPVKSSVLNNLK